MIQENLKKIKSSLPQGVTLVAVSKTKPNGDILEAYETGHRIFGENKVQELTSKYEELPKDIEWHMIGHLQRNKVKYIAPFVKLIHGVDSLRLLKEINKQAKKAERVQDVLLQMHIAEESTKFGLDENELKEILEQLDEFPHVRVIGLMGMATFTDDKAKIAREFSLLASIFEKYKRDYQLTTLSMGMSGDYPIAIENGSNMIRVGSSIFGERNYG
ncbi:YggS family pyridoxal phosphate-dependent enzyme [Parvicella tangerina]|uniref:Pyridoxal phosphate homeostasis protein n=1 Tax=Parvicella tangerina TaxID=2829795 RepID=A0A916NKB6_9FLAO|nr:YggS family pyridoxal phosphate-dependent enzyme [Parvicella tangerina]CAG5087298.1 Pyridoxal phosphate homeostasis protein [Parvicella tangerina]